MDRRQFLHTAALGGAAVAAGLKPAQASASDSETLVAQLYSTLTDEQKSLFAFPFDDPLRSQVNNNWHITDARVGRTLNGEQQALVGEIFRGLHNPDFYPQVEKHIVDDGGSLASYSVALFGEPGSGKFEFVLTGRHCTARCDGDSVEGAAFGGPIFYGHEGEQFYEKPDHPNNVYWFQAERANEVFRALDPKQREAALLGDARRERQSHTVALRDEPEGLPVSEMTRDQRELVEATLEDLLLPFREADRREAMSLIRKTGGVESLSMAFFRNHDIGGDAVWDVWQLESPTMVWHFRGAPHVHVWVNIQENPGWQPPAGASGRGRRRARRNRRS